MTSTSGSDETAGRYFLPPLPPDCLPPPAGVSRVVRIHLVRAVVGDRLVCTAVRVGLVGLVVHPCLVRRTVRVHLIGVVVAIRLVRHAVGWLLQIAVNT